MQSVNHSSDLKEEDAEVEERKSQTWSQACKLIKQPCGKKKGSFRETMKKRKKEKN